ncbi:MAG TPA: hypothetical protein VIK89_07875 [Cytophagaceae bacterium]
MNVDNSYLENIGLITIENIRLFLKDAKFKGIRCILLNQIDMDKIAIELRNSYRERFFEPYLINGVQIKEDYDRSTPAGRIRVVTWIKK